MILVQYKYNYIVPHHHSARPTTLSGIDHYAGQLGAYLCQSLAI